MEISSLLGRKSLCMYDSHTIIFLFEKKRLREYTNVSCINIPVQKPRLFHLYWPASLKMALTSVLLGAAGYRASPNGFCCESFYITCLLFYYIWLLSGLVVAEGQLVRRARLTQIHTIHRGVTLNFFRHPHW